MELLPSVKEAQSYTLRTEEEEREERGREKGKEGRRENGKRKGSGLEKKKETVFRMDEDRRIRCTLGGAQGSGSCPVQLFLSLMMENRCGARKSRN